MISHVGTLCAECTYYWRVLVLVCTITGINAFTFIVTFVNLSLCLSSYPLRIVPDCLLVWSCCPLLQHIGYYIQTLISRVCG
jgi:hypothetical protein